MIKLLITGSNGQLGSEFRSLSAGFPGFEFIFTDIDELDIASAHAVDQILKNGRFHALINCASYTQVDQAEEEPEIAFQVNARATKILAETAKRYSCYMVHISTDYVFDGRHYYPYSEEDPPRPVSVYGNTKLEGEKSFAQSGVKGMIIRTSWLYSSFGKNFIKTILQAASERKEIRVVSDQAGSPTYARHLAGHLLEILPGAISGNIGGIFHYANEGICSWYDLAHETIRMAELECKVIPIATSDYPTAAPRPFYSVLDKSKIRKQFGISIPQWREGLRECIEFRKNNNDG